MPKRPHPAPNIRAPAASLKSIVLLDGISNFLPKKDMIEGATAC